MPFADPHACPSCTGPIAGESQCPHCQFDLSSPASLQLWQTLVKADSLLDQARRESWSPTADSTVGPPPPVRLAPAVPTVPRKHWSTGSIILALGAICLLVAGFVFITVSWDVLGPTGRTLVLLVITLALALAATWSVRARLRASAEALWAVFFGLFTIDFFAARGYDLFGLDSFSDEQAALVFGIIATLLGGAVVLATRKTLTVVVPSVAAGLAVWTASASLSATVDWGFFWSAFAGLALATLSTAIAGRLALSLIAWIAGAAATVLYAIAAGGAIDELASSPHLADLAGQGHGIPMLVMIVLTADIALVQPKLAVPASALATLGVGSLLFTPAEAAAPHEGGFLSASAIAVFLAFALLRGTNGWVRGARIAGGLILVSLGAGSLAWLGNALDAVGRSNGAGFTNLWSNRLSNSDALPGEGWLAIVVFGAMAISVFAVLRWPEASPHARPFAVLPPIIGGIGIVLGVVSYEPPVIVAAFAVLALGIAMLVLVRAEHELWLGGALLVTIMPVVMTLVSKPVTVVVWLAVAVTFAGVAKFSKPSWARRVGSFGATALVIAAAALGADLASLDEVGIRLVAVVVSVLALVGATFVLRDFVARREIEVAAGLGILITLLSDTDMSLGSQALLWTVAGASLVVLGLVVHDRHWFRFVGSAALGVAWVMRLLASDIDTVEAYTAPFAVVLLGAGLWAMRGNPQLRTFVALSPGLTLALVPSIPQALDDPTGLRALMLGVAGFLALGVGVGLSWQMPFVFGSGVVALLVVWNVGPLANGLPRWTLIAVAGVVLVGSGITWENRVRNAKSAATYVQNLR